MSGVDVVVDIFLGSRFEFFTRIIRSQDILDNYYVEVSMAAMNISAPHVFDFTYPLLYLGIFGQP